MLLIWVDLQREALKVLIILMFLLFCRGMSMSLIWVDVQHKGRTEKCVRPYVSPVSLWHA